MAGSSGPGEAVNNFKARMPTASALQLPLSKTPAESLGSRLFRKRLLPVGRVKYEGRNLDFTADYLRKLAHNFSLGAYDQVPFVLADAENKHNQAPENFRGDVKGLEFTGDGLDAIIEVTEDGAKIVRDNPKLGVSARIVEQDRGLETPRATPAVQHVCATLDPVATRLGDWQAVSDLATSYSAEQVIDLTAETYEQMPPTDGTTTTLTDEQRTALAGAKVPEDQYEAVAEIFAKPGEGEGTEAGTPAATPKPEEKKNEDEPTGIKAILAKLTGRKPEEFSDEKIAALTERGEPAKPKDGEVQEVALTPESQQAIDSAASDSAQAKRDADAARSELADLRFTAEKDKRTKAGVPPALIDLCEPVIRRGPNSGVIELSSGENFDAHKFVTGLLDEAQGTIDLSGEYGKVVSEDDQQLAEAAEKAEELGKAG